jgi:hypothetical protein
MAFYTPVETNDPYAHLRSWTALWGWIVTKATLYFTRLPDQADQLVHVEALLMDGVAYGPEQYECLTAKPRLFRNQGFKSFIEIPLSKDDYVRVTRFLEGEARDNVGFDYLGFLNFIWFSPFYCTPIDMTRDTWLYRRRWHCSALMKRCLELTERFSHSTNPFVEELMARPACQTSVNDVYYMLNRSLLGSCTTSVLEDRKEKTPFAKRRDDESEAPETVIERYARIHANLKIELSQGSLV